jgi:hypothetical protein
VTTVPSRPAIGLTQPLTARPPGPDPVRLAALLARTWLEVRAGQRPLAQLRPLVAPAVHHRLAAQLSPRIAGAPGPPARIRKVVARWPSERACEATVLVEQAGRTTALAIRLEPHRGTWRAVELSAPEAGLPALSTASLPAHHRVRDAFDEVLEEAGELPSWDGAVRTERRHR